MFGRFRAGLALLLADGRRAAGVHDFFNSVLQGGLQHVDRATNIDIEVDSRTRRPRVEMSGQMEDARATGDRIADTRGVNDISSNDLYGVIDPTNVAIFAGKHANGVAAFNERVNQRRSSYTCGSSHQRRHSIRRIR